MFYPTYPYRRYIHYFTRHILTAGIFIALSDISLPPVYSLLLVWFLTNFLSPLQKFSFQDQENSRIIIAPDRIVPDPKDPDHEDKMPKNTRATSTVGKASSSRHLIQDWSDDDSNGECQMYLDPTPLAYAFPTVPSSAISRTMKL
jgi:hypothetical protein